MLANLILLVELWLMLELCAREKIGRGRKNGIAAALLAAACSQSYRSGDDDEYGCVSDGDAVGHYGSCGGNSVSPLVDFVEDGVMLHPEWDLSGVAAGFVSKDGSLQNTCKLHR